MQDAANSCAAMRHSAVVTSAASRFGTTMADERHMKTTPKMVCRMSAQAWRHYGREREFYDSLHSGF